MHYLKIFEYKIKYLESRKQLYHTIQHMADLLKVSTQHRAQRNFWPV